jgi:membrane protease YdiL (CAAX protease family)
MLLYSLFSLATFIKIRTVGDLGDLGFRLDNIGATLLPNILLVLGGTAVLYTMRTRMKEFKVFSWLISLVGLYFIFGIVQQFFFQSVFTHSLYGILGSRLPVVVISGIFFASFHWGRGVRFGLMTLVAGSVMAYLFLTSPNVILLGVSHAILASVYYYFVDERDTLDNRLSLKHA